MPATKTANRKPSGDYEVTTSDGTIVPFKQHAAAIAKVDRKTVSRINDVAGKNPLAFNLRDHPEFSGMDIYVMDATFKQGTLDGNQTTYVLATVRICAPGADPNEVEPGIMMTGSSNVFDRIVAAMQANALPVVGTLRKSGRAWFID